MVQTGLSYPSEGQYVPAQRALSPQLLTQLVNTVAKLEVEHTNAEARIANLERRVDRLEAGSDTTDTAPDTNTILLVGGISGSGPDAQGVETITVLGNPDCHVTPLRYKYMLAAAVTVTTGQESFPLLCGGELVPDRHNRMTRTYSAQCYTLVGREWVEHSLMTKERHGFGLVSVPKGVYAFGGIMEDADRISDVLLAGSHTWQSGPQIPGPRQGFWRGCAVAIDDTHIMIAGGDLDGRQLRKYDVTNDEWSFWPDLPFSAQWQGCIRTPDGVLLTGGQRGRYVSAESHLINLTTGQLETVGSLNGPRRGHKLVEHDGAILAIGGGNDDGDIDRIEEWVPETKSWVTKSITLPQTRGFFAAVSIPTPTSEFCLGS